MRARRKRPDAQPSYRESWQENAHAFALESLPLPCGGTQLPPLT
jgi:hypothetical protein